MNDLQDVKVERGRVWVPLAGADPVLVQEQPLSKYREFLRSWEAGIAVSVENRTASFSSLWTHSDRFRVSMVQALAHLGIEDPERFTPSVLEQLLLIHNDPDHPKDLRAALFKLHQDAPNPKMIGAQTATPHP